MILLAGATGLLGGMIADRLLGADRETRILVRVGSDFAALVRRGAQPYVGDLRDPSTLISAVRGARVVISTANSAGRGGEDTVETVEIAGNRALIDAAANAGVEHFIFVSALGAAMDSPIPFLRGKALAEEHLRASGMAYTILQPNLFLEIWAGMLIAAPMLAGLPVYLIGEGTMPHSMISVGDVASFAVASLDNPEARNRTLVLGGPEPLTWREVAARFEKLTGRTAEIRSIPIGEPLPGFPDVITGLATGLATSETPIPMEETARTFGVRLTSIDEVIPRLIPPVELHPAPPA